MPATLTLTEQLEAIESELEARYDQAADALPASTDDYNNYGEALQGVRNALGALGDIQP